MSVLSQPHFHDEAAAYKFVEAKVWPNGPVCPRCGGGDRVGELKGKSTRIGVRKCYRCRKPFTVKINTIFESSHVPLQIWLQAMHLIASSKKGISANQLHRTLGVTLKTAWFMGHRIREAMTQVGFKPMGGKGKIVEADETYFGDKKVVTKRTKRGKSGLASKRPVLALVERGGNVRSFSIGRATKVNVSQVVRENIDRETRLMTDESRLYGNEAEHFSVHDTIQHYAGVYVRGDVHTNTIEGVFSIFKRGMKGIYQHCSEKHLHRYLAEFDFRYNERHVDDVTRASNLLNGVVGKRLYYRQPA